ncbi:MAG: hypothetical protein ACRDL4_02695 [Thermoleophilaceae bacterium]
MSTDRSESRDASIAECRLDLAGLHDQRERYRALGGCSLPAAQRSGSTCVSLALAFYLR